MYFIEGLLMLDRKEKIFIVVDKRTKYIHFMAVKKMSSKKQIAEDFCKNIYKLRGLPKTIVNNRYIKFKWNFWKDFCNQVRISLNMSSVCIRQIDEQKEVVKKMFRN